MRLLGSNLLPFSVAQLPGTWSTGIEVEAYFFEGDMPSDLTAYFQDHRKLISDAVAASRIVLQPTTEGLAFMQAYSYGWKAIAGSVYDPKMGVTIHYPKSILPRRTTASSSALDVDTAYAVDLPTGNSKMKQHMSVGLYPGFPVGTLRQLSDFVGNTVSQIANVADLDFGRAITFDAALADSYDRSAAATLLIAAQGTGGTTSAGSMTTLTVPANVDTNRAGGTINTDILRVTGNANSVRRVLPVTMGDVSTAKVSKTIGYAILLIPDSNFGSQSIGTYDIRFMATKVGAKNSGELIELESLTISTGEYAEVVQVRTSTELEPNNGLPLWVDPNAKLALSASYFGASPSKDAFGTPFTFTGWPQQSDNAIKGTKGSSIAVEAANHTFDPTKSFTIQFDFKQDVTDRDCEFLILQTATSFNDRFIISLDQSNEKGLLIWNNQQSSKIQRAWSLYSVLRTTTFVKFKYVYDAKTATHTISVNGNVIDSFVYAVLPITKTLLTVKGAYESTTSAIATIRNYQIIQAPSASEYTYQQFLDMSANLPVHNIAGSFDQTSGARILSFESQTPVNRTLWGSPYGTYFTYDSGGDNVVNHSCPDRDVYNELVLSKRRTVALCKFEGNLPSFVSVDRNGYVSSSYGSFGGYSISKFVYWDYKLSKMMQVNPFAASAPVAWDGTF